MGRYSRFTDEQQKAFLAEWKSSGDAAADFAKRLDGVSPQMLYNWRLKFQGPTIPYSIVVPVEMTEDVHFALLTRARAVSATAGRQVGIEEYAASVLRNFLIADKSCDRLRSDATTTGSSRAAKGRRRGPRGGRSGKDAAAAARRVGPKARTRTRGRKGAGKAGSSRLSPAGVAIVDALFRNAR